MHERNVTVRVRGEFACFTRPESKVERVSYPIVTPSAARGILEAIYWHPEFTWRINAIHVLAPVRTFSILRNEVEGKMSPSSDFMFANEHRTQRHSVCLRDVDYLLVAEPIAKPGTENPQKHREIFERRVAKGRCFHRPCLGTREFAAEFDSAANAPDPIDWNDDLGLMLWDLDFSSGKPPYRPMFFRANVEGGVMHVPNEPLRRTA